MNFIQSNSNRTRVHAARVVSRFDLPSLCMVNRLVHLQKQRRHSQAFV